MKVRNSSGTISEIKLLCELVYMVEMNESCFLSLKEGILLYMLKEKIRKSSKLCVVDGYAKIVTKL